MNQHDEASVCVCVCVCVLCVCCVCVGDLFLESSKLAQSALPNGRREPARAKHTEDAHLLDLPRVHRAVIEENHLRERHTAICLETLKVLPFRTRENLLQPFRERIQSRARCCLELCEKLKGPLDLACAIE